MIDRMIPHSGAGRIYLTDLTGDNVAVDERTLNVAFVDLDHVVIVDSNARPVSTKWDTTHAHDKIECNGCFAYVPADLCAHHLSDLNVFAVCQVKLSKLIHSNCSRSFLSAFAAPN